MDKSVNLCIGDYVMVRSKVAVITGVIGDLVLTQGYLVTRDEVEPVRLTSEILKDNSFQPMEKYDDSWIRRGDGFNVRLFFDDEAAYVVIASGDKEYENDEVRYLHELQQACRLVCPSLDLKVYG